MGKLNVVELVSPSERIEPILVPAIVKLLHKMRALEAIAVVGETIAIELIEAILRHTTAKYIQFGEHAENNELEMVHWCLYNRVSGELIATNAKWYAMLPRLPVASAEFQISSAEQIRSIVVAWRRAENVHFKFGAIDRSPSKALVYFFIELCRSLTHSNAYELGHMDFRVEIQRRPHRFLQSDESRAIKVALLSHMAMQSVGFIPYAVAASTSAYNVAFRRGFAANLENIANFDFSPSMGGMIRTLRFDEPHLLQHFLGQYARSSHKSYTVDYGSVEAIGGLVDDKLCDADIPFEDLLMLSNRLQFILLQLVNGSGPLHIEWPEEFRVEASAEPCWRAFGLKWPSADAGNAICVSVPRKIGPHKVGRKCLLYGMDFTLNVAH